MPRAPGPLPPWAKALEAALRFLGQHLARLRHQLGRQLAKVARRGPKKTLALGAPPPENISRAPEAPPELLPKLEAEPAEALFTSFDLLLLAGALAVVAFVAWQSYKKRPEAVVRSVTPPLTPEDKGPTEPRTLPGRFRAVLRGAQSPDFASPQSFEERRSRQPPARRRSRSRPPKPGSPRGAPDTVWKSTSELGCTGMTSRRWAGRPKFDFHTGPARPRPHKNRSGRHHRARPGPRSSTTASRCWTK